MTETPDPLPGLEHVEVIARNGAEPAAKPPD
jgi:hypothetical protein